MLRLSSARTNSQITKMCPPLIWPSAPPVESETSYRPQFMAFTLNLSTIIPVVYYFLVWTTRHKVIRGDEKNLS